MKIVYLALGLWLLPGMLWAQKCGERERIHHVDANQTPCRIP